MPDEHDVLFIHPNNHIHPDCLPIGALTAVNSLERPCLGRYAVEVSEAEIRSAKVILLEAHWFLALGVLEGIVDGIRNVSPRVPIVVGGISAALFARRILEELPVDHVMTCDVEAALPSLVEAICEGRPTGSLPNLVSRGMEHPRESRRLTNEQFDALDFLGLDWFPTNRKRVLEEHAQYQKDDSRLSALDRFRRMSTSYPFLGTSRGCRRRCGHCAGAYQDAVLGHEILHRSPEGLLRDLRRVAAAPDLHCVNVFLADGLGLVEISRGLEGQSLPIDAVLWLCGNAERDSVQRLRSCFAGHVVFTIIEPAGMAPLPSDPAPAEQSRRFEELLELCGSMPRTSAVIFTLSEDHCDATMRAHRRHPELITPWSCQDWKVLAPTQERIGDADEEREHLRDIVEAAKAEANTQLLKALVPQLRLALAYRLDLGLDEEALREAGLEAFERSLVKMHWAHLIDHGRYGFADVTLEAQQRIGEFEAPRWAPPSSPLPGLVQTGIGMGTYSWRAELRVREGPGSEILFCPSVHVPGFEVARVSDWSKARVSAVPISGGPARTVVIRAVADDEAVAFTVEDSGTTARHVLPFPGFAKVRAWMDSTEGGTG